MDPCGQLSLPVTEGALEGREPSSQDSSPRGWVVGCGEGRGRGGIPSPMNPVPSSTQKVSPPSLAPLLKKRQSACGLRSADFCFHCGWCGYPFRFVFVGWLVF